MITLGLDTSEAWGGVAVQQEGALLTEEMMAGRLRHAEELIPLIERVLDKCGPSKDRIGLVSVNRGPGSFTGLRIGLATAKGICQSLGIPLVGVDGTFAYCARLDTTGRVCVLIPDRRDLVYVRWFSGMRALGEIRVQSSTTLLAQLAEERKELVVVGSGVEPLREELMKYTQIKLAPEAMNCPSPAWIARLGEKTYTKDQLYELEPTYVEPAFAKMIP